MKKEIDTNVLKYIPKKLVDRVVACDRIANSSGRQGYTYNIIFDYVEETSIFADGVEGLKWALKQVQNGRRGVIYA